MPSGVAFCVWGDLLGLRLAQALSLRSPRPQEMPRQKSHADTPQCEMKEVKSEPESNRHNRVHFNPLAILVEWFIDPFLHGIDCSLLQHCRTA